MNQQSDSKVEVVVAAIDGDCIVLETVPHKNRICWPLKNIPQPLDIGSRLTLELQQSGIAEDEQVNLEQAKKEERKRLLLEQLVN